MIAEAPRTIVHVAQVEISRESGMGRVAWHWRQALEERGYSFLHIGASDLGRPVHPALFPHLAWRRFRKLGIRPRAFLVHEPNGAPFVRRDAPALVFSHGLEQRGWEATLARAAHSGTPIRARSRLLFPFWRLRPANYALRRARAVLVLNRDDHAAMQERFGRRPKDLLLFRNGVDPVAAAPRRLADAMPATVLFLGTWMDRKGTATLVAAAEILHRKGVPARYRLAGTGIAEEEVVAAWPAELRGSVSVLPSFPASAEAALYAQADLFVLPSVFEGQPLALLQAMAAGCCCLVSDIGGNRDLVHHRRSGLLHAAGDAAELASQMAECLTSSLLREELGSAAQRAVAGREWRVTAGEVADFITGILATERGAAA